MLATPNGQLKHSKWYNFGMDISIGLADRGIERLVAATAGAFAVASIRRLDTEAKQPDQISVDSAAVELRGRLLLPPEQAYDLIARRFRALHHVALLRRVDGVDVVFAVPGDLPRTPARYRVAIGLFLATLLSVLWTGAAQEGSLELSGILSGWPFAASLLSILVAHELGHFFVARRLGVPVSPPYFVPFPFPLSIFGTLGAVVRMAAPPRSRSALLAVAVAGPLAGLVVAIPVLVVGLLLSPVQATPVGEPIMQEGNSLLYAGLKYLVFGRWLPAGNEDVFLHPVALAGWAGLLVTGLNLIPVGQLDGGHVIYTLLGGRSRWLNGIVVGALLGLSLLWQGWLLWAALGLLLSRSHAVPFDDVTPLSRGQTALAAVMLLIFLAVFTPIPLDFR